ncbi:xanthine dehydrogenase small subunit [Alteromonas sp. C1M14]|uniref:xanthine dehydrogenase small subunit n=1 Tax=Alteromonas sp. C1M14 TaxID=2841567 RepID=UPI001C09FB6A|nr:xanthine dehydrogenase small subunit [Alteromonas sp. C1M14]MBU2978928.1 xanthine dehydrogenase small subunit [Alteromonas sp. C1M14]
MVRFLLNDEPVELQVNDPNLTVLRYLREQQSQCGTKEGCAAGDCGACTVVVAAPTPTGDELQYRTINSCIALMSSLHGKQLITVENLGNAKSLHPVQQAMVDNHGSQCGFCTPGFIMSAFALYHSSVEVDREEAIHALSGNLCRCTGYRPIIDAALSACAQRQPDQFDAQKEQTISALLKLGSSCADKDAQALIMPTNRQQLADAMASHPLAKLVAGSTDLALDITQGQQQFDTLISLSQMAELKQIEITEHTLEIGAMAALNDVACAVTEVYPQLQELFTRFASLPIRNQATLGGNIANASPIGDTPPVMLALEASLVLDNGEECRTVAARDFFTGYRQTVMAKNEWIRRVIIPKKQPNQRVAAYKISKRQEDDISAVCAVFSLTIENHVVTKLTSGFGGVAATPVCCPELEQALVGLTWSDPTCLATGKQILANAFSPIDDVRASAAYRKQVLANLWHRFWLEHQTDNLIPTRVVSHA